MPPSPLWQEISTVFPPLWNLQDARESNNGFQLLARPKEREWRGAWRPGGGADGGRPCFRLLSLPPGLKWRDSDALQCGQWPPAAHVTEAAGTSEAGTGDRGDTALTCWPWLDSFSFVALGWWE